MRIAEPTGTHRRMRRRLPSIVSLAALLNCRKATANPRDYRQKIESFPVKVPMFVMSGDLTIQGFGQEMTSRDVHFLVDEKLVTEIGERFEFLIQLPTPISRTYGCLLRCHCRLVRSEPSSAFVSGVYARIVRFSILRGRDVE